MLHVLPHPGGGGETYVDLLDEMPGYRFERVYLAASPTAITRASSCAASRTLLGARAVTTSLHVHGEVAAGLCLPLLAHAPFDRHAARSPPRPPAQRASAGRPRC